MCLSIALDRPGDVLARGEHLGFEWIVTQNRTGYRCGYVRVPAGHPWHGKDLDELGDVECHRGATFAEPDRPCDKGGDDDAYWIGFDCAHAGDLQDPSLVTPAQRDVSTNVSKEVAAYFASHGLSVPEETGVVRTQEYVEAECRSICEQAKAHMIVSLAPT